MMATLHRTESGGMVLIKGSPEIVLSRCQDLTPQGVSAVLELVTQMASDGLRVLAFARQTRLSAEGPFSFEDLGYQFSFLGLQGMIDPPREEAIDSISLCHQAGIEVKMITGDHHETAQAIGKQLGILEPGTTAVRGLELAQMGDEQMRQAARSSNVFARVAPEHKLRLVKALQQLGSIAAMTGDGVNDAPALKQANIGVAMGITGTSVSKEAADIVLMDDNFASIAAAVEEGRRVYDNLVKSLAFVLPTNLGLAFILIYAVLFFPFENGELVVPMLPTQLLWINLVAAVALALPLAFEAKEDDIMRRPPRDVNEPLIGGFVLVRTFLAASLMTAGAVIMFKTILGENLAAGIPMVLATAKAQTMAVTTVIFFQIFYMLNCRSLKRSVFSIGLWSNWTVYVGIAVVLGLQAAFIYSPAFQTVFATGPLDGLDLATAALIGFLITPAIALEKWWRSRAETGVVRRS
jgi:Ca2+-transporting ATPase